MNPPPFQRRDILCTVDVPPQRWRVLHRGINKTVLFDMDVPLAWPTMGTTSMLDNDVHAGVLVLDDEVDAPRDEFSDKAKNHADKKYLKYRSVLNAANAETDLLAEDGLLSPTEN